MTAGAIAVPTIVPLRAPVPGQHKTCIDTNTKLELRSETLGTTLYYTINGSKPEPFQNHGPAAKATFKYREPFRLPGGKRTIRVIAIGEDGLRESHVMSKTFDVDQLPTSPTGPQDDGYNFINDMPANEMAKKEVKKFANKMVTSKEAWNEVQRMRDNEDMMRGDRRKAGTGTKYMNNRLGSASDRVTVGQNTVPGSMNGVGMNGSMDPDQLLKYKRQPPDNATQALRLQRETDFLKCIYCFAARPADPYARFCNECGNPVPPIPQNRMPPPEPGQMGTCVSCHSLVPFNTGSCLVCEAPLGPQNTPQASVRLAERLICTSCGTANPPNLAACVTCEARLPTIAKPIFHGHTAPPMPREDGRLQTCTKCSRVNNPDARFCDWCGAKPQPATTSLVCSKCQASNHPYAKHCASCGVTLEPPVRNDVRNSGHALNLQKTAGTSTQAQWLPVSLPTAPAPKYDVSTQTVGLFYPSQRQLSQKDQEEEDKLAMEKQIRDRKPLMTAVSPGRGYWRKQMEHVGAHLKAYAANNAEFRALIGEPRMGKLTSAAVHEDGYELSLTINFALRGTKDPFVGKEMGVSRDFLSSYTTGRKSSLRSYGSMDSLTSAQSTARTGKKKSARKTKKKVKIVRTKALEDDITTEDKQLLKELGKSGEGSSGEVHQLIEEGADPNCVGKDGMPALHLATLNKHVDAIPILVQEGAEANRKGPNRGNTALHEAVSLGTKGYEVIDTLLGCGANPQKKNDKGETPYDLAVKSGYDTIANKFAASLGQSALDKLTKPRSSQKIEDY